MSSTGVTMAGYGHGSVTGIDERTLGRIDLMLFDADYADAASAVEDSWRVAVLASDTRLRAGRERARLDAVVAANRARDPHAPERRPTTNVHRVALALAFVLAATAAAFATTPPSTAGLQATLLPSGLCALMSIALLWRLEPRRADGSLWGTRVPAVLLLVCTLLWAVAAGGAVLTRWGEIDGYRALAPATGLTLLCLSAAGGVLLWHRARRADRAGGQSGIARVTSGLDDERDAGEVLAALDAWWRIAGPAALARDGDRVRRVRTESLARLAHARVITAEVARKLGAEQAPLRWRERRR